MKKLKKLLAVVMMIALMIPVTAFAAEGGSVQTTTLTTANVTVAAATYTGKAQTSKVTVKDGSKVLTVNKDYTVTNVTKTNAGNYTVTVKGMGSYTGTVTATYKINKASIAKATVAVSKVAYTGKQASPKTIQVKVGKTTLKQGTDYTVAAISKSKKPGTVKQGVKIVGKGNYTGTVYGALTINKAANTMKVSSGKNFKASALKKKAGTCTITVKNAKGKVTYKSSSKKVKVNSKGKVTVAKGTKKGTYKITVKAAGNTTYKAKSATFKVVVK
ncbi:MAG: hypothetical protein NC225_09080 [Clostridium sp.]|nr:hypothetical protein [Clostridium sp.]MCM1399615.1 hypothetical protein [Clostridium sp.]MCM1460169.1 hypothetical protein [Bacteroides sp.]